MAYNLSEENKELREQIQKYEELLEKLLEGPKIEGIVESNEFNGIYRLIVNDKPSFAPSAKQLGLKPGTRVMVTKDGIIADILPEELMPKKEPVKFNFIKWEEIGGLKSQVEKIRETISYPTKYQDLYKEYGLSSSKGIVLYGPAGCGKTMIAKAIASEILSGTELDEDSFIYLKGGEMLSPYVGVAENNIKSIFDRSRRHYKKTGNKTVIFIDEAEAILPARGSRRSSDVETTIVPTFLSEMDGFEDNSTFIILATNFLGQLDEAVIRPGRIDLRVKINRPTEEDVEDILRIYLNQTHCASPVDELIKDFMPILTQDQYMVRMSGAVIKNLVDKAAVLSIKDAVESSGKKHVFRKSAHGITIDHLKKALDY